MMFVTATTIFVVFSFVFSEQLMTNDSSQVAIFYWHKVQWGICVMLSSLFKLKVVGQLVKPVTGKNLVS